jgi:3-methyladenine DNA glycosylase/8-oxoguanine DNA glycosylase
MRDTELALVGAGGEPVDFRRTLASHGVATLPPNVVDEEAWTLTTTLGVDGSVPPTVHVRSGPPGHAVVSAPGASLKKAERDHVLQTIRHMLRLDEDLSGFYAQVAADPDLSWAAAGAGRMLRSPSVFEDVVKTICTTNCTWSATERMVGAIVGELGRAGAHGRTFPSAEVMAEADLSFYRDVARAGYRGAYLQTLARSVAAGDTDLEDMALDRELPDDEVERRLLALPGVGPYAAAQIMVLIGRYSRLILDSWTRPKYARLLGKKQVADRTMTRRFARYGPFAGLAFWLFLTRDWVAD